MTPTELHQALERALFLHRELFPLIERHPARNEEDGEGGEKERWARQRTIQKQLLENGRELMPCFDRLGTILSSAAPHERRAITHLVEQLRGVMHALAENVAGEIASVDTARTGIVSTMRDLNGRKQAVNAYAAFDSRNH